MITLQRDNVVRRVASDEAARKLRTLWRRMIYKEQYEQRIQSN